MAEDGVAAVIVVTIMFVASGGFKRVRENIALSPDLEAARAKRLGVVMLLRTAVLSHQ